MSDLFGWLVPDRIAPTPMDALLVAFSGACAELPIVLDSALRKYCGLTPGAPPITDREALVLRAVRQVSSTIGG